LVSYVVNCQIQSIAQVESYFIISIMYYFFPFFRFPFSHKISISFASS
jgi:hypothetical protein